MSRYFIKTANEEAEEFLRKRDEKLKERFRMIKDDLSRIKDVERRRDYLRYMREGGWIKKDLDYKYGI